MTITILSAGSQGDVQPYLALAVAIQRRGYRVRLAANSNFSAQASVYGVDFVPIRVDALKFVQSKQAQSWLASRSALKLLQNTNRVIRPVLNIIFEDTWQASQGSELLIYHSYTLPFAYYFGRHLEIPCLPASIYPMPTRAHPPLPMKMNRSPGSPLNYLGHIINDQAAWQVFRPLFEKFWRDKGPVGFFSPYRSIIAEGRPILCSYSPAVLPRPGDLPPQVEITGYWFLDPPPDWQPDPALESFLRSGPPPIYLGFGSMGNPARNRETLAIVLQALEITGSRAILTAGWSGMGTDQTLPDHVFLLKDAPHRWLFPQTAAIVHHGGVGTTGAALGAGVPNVVVPHFADQHFWGAQVAALGVGPRPVPRDALTAAKLAAAISQATNNPDYAARAKALGEKITAEDGTQQAVQIVQEVLAGGKL